ADDVLPAHRFAQRSSAGALDGVGRALRRAVDARQDRRSGRARQRRAPRAVRRPVAADVLAHQRLAGASRAPPPLAL
ncbi:MAG: hypothetical protein AVDCRST_MAG67-2858, partial [uncultured Solirubrobacteraceae bacterium]